jgi:hypothetical protein
MAGCSCGGRRAVAASNWAGEGRQRVMSTSHRRRTPVSSSAIHNSHSFFFENMGHCHSGRPAGLPRRSPGWVCVGKKKANNPDRPITAVQLERPGLPRNSQQPTTGSNCIFVSGGHPTCIFFILLFSIYIYPTVGRLADVGGQEDVNTGGVLACTRGSSTASR